MLSKEEFKQYKLEFWEEFKRYMGKHRSTSGRKINWLNYPTEYKNFYLRLVPEKDSVAVNFDIQDRDDSVRAIIWEQMGELQKVLYSYTGEATLWDDEASNNVLPTFCQIQWKKEGLNYMKREDREEIFQFFEKILVAFDEFYQEFKDIILHLVH